MEAVTGRSATVELVVGDDDTANSFRSGDVPVLATPRLIALAEQATVEALAEAVDPDETTVGCRVQIDHLTPTPVGEKVTAEAVVEGTSGRRITFRVNVTDDRGLVAVGRVTRVVVDRERFLERAAGH